MLAEDRQVGSLERLIQLRKAPIVGSLRPELLSTLAEALRLRTLRQGELLFVEGAPIGAAQFLVEGRLHLERGGRTVGHAGAGTALGEVGVVARAPALVTATAETDALTLELVADAFLDLVEDHFGILRHYLREVCGRIIDDWKRFPRRETPHVMPESRQPSEGLRDLDLVERIFQIRQQPLFRRARINALADLSRTVSEVHLGEGDHLWAEDEPARYVMLLLAGEARGRSRAGFELLAGPGWALGAVESIAGRPRWYEAQVTRPLVALTAEIEVLFDVFEDNPDLALSFLSAISRMSLQLSAELVEAASEPLVDGAALDVSRIGPAAEAHPAGSG